MPTLNLNNIDKLYYGNTEAQKLYKGSQLLYPPNIVDPYLNNVVLHIKGDGANNSTNIVDSSPNPKSITRFGDTKISTDQSKYGESSIYFDGNGDYLTVPHSSDFYFDSSNFTLEFWLYPLAWKAEDPLLTKFNAGGTPDTNQWYFGQYNNNLNFVISENGSTGIELLSSTAPSLNQWHHIAITRFENTFKLFVDGLTTVQAINNTTLFNNSSEVLGIGYRRNNLLSTQNNIFAYIDLLRITKGIARYTANFNPETDTYLAY